MTPTAWIWIAAVIAVVAMAGFAVRARVSHGRKTEMHQFRTRLSDPRRSEPTPLEAVRAQNESPYAVWRTRYEGLDGTLNGQNPDGETTGGSTKDTW